MEQIKIVKLLISILCCIVVAGLNTTANSTPETRVSTDSLFTNRTGDLGVTTPSLSTVTQRQTSTSRSVTASGIQHTGVSTQWGSTSAQLQSSTGLPISFTIRRDSTISNRFPTQSSRFTCHDGSGTINATLLCNGRMDCPDSSDENSPLCNGTSCMYTFPCLNGKCVGPDSFCNGTDECGDNSDEQLSTCIWPSIHVCTDGQVLIGRNITCNGVYNCMDKSDEFNCTKCPGGLSCDRGRRCVKPEAICDRIQDCYDGADESCLSPDNTRCNVSDFICPTGICVTGGRFISGNRCWGSQVLTPADNQKYCKPPNVLCDGGNKCIPPEYRCDGKLDCQDGTDEMSPNKNIMSGPNYKCGNGFCVPYLALCNNTDECGDNSDEYFGNGQCTFSAVNCSSVESVRPFYWQCNNSLCISSYQVNNGANNCGDLSDEMNSTTFFTCSNKKRVLRPFLCDGLDNCGDNSDETDLSCTVNATRSTRCPQQSCPSGKCIFNTDVCDGYNDCGDHTDELSCPPKQTCRQHTCRSGKCINFSDVCDGLNDCGDNSDEIGCASCYSFQFRCASGQCISVSERCNGVYNCYDNSDEFGCMNPVCSGHTCPSGTCILSSEMCDGVNDCGDNSDETDITCIINTCSEHTCPSGKCILYSDVCDGYDDCGDDSDESYCSWTYTHSNVAVGVCVPGGLIIIFIGGCFGFRRRRMQTTTRTTRPQAVTATTTVASDLPPSYAQAVGSPIVGQGYTNQAFGSSVSVPT